jgi:hypothetical protein
MQHLVLHTTLRSRGGTHTSHVIKQVWHHRIGHKRLDLSEGAAVEGVSVSLSNSSYIDNDIGYVAMQQDQAEAQPLAQGKV